MKHVLIFTHSQDNPSIASVMDRLQHAGVDVTRFDTDRYPMEFTVDAKQTSRGSQHILTTPEGKTCSMDKVDALWYRRFYTGHDIDPNMEPQMRSVCHEESREAIIGLLSCLACFQMDAYWTVRQASVKDYQLKVAASLGLGIPETLFTNNQTEAHAFFDHQHGDIVTKTQGSFGIWKNGETHVMYTSTVTEEHMKNTAGLIHCPMVFQKKIRKKLELRVTVVGTKVFCAAIDSGVNEATETDWRTLASTTMSNWFPYELPEDIEQKVLKLTHKLNLKYGAIDILVTPNDDYIFLEINPCGEFYWVETHVGFPVCEAISELLIEHA